MSTRRSVVSQSSPMGATSISFVANLEDEDAYANDMPMSNPFAKVSVAPMMERPMSTLVDNAILEDPDYQAQTRKDKQAQRMSLINQQHVLLKQRQFGHSRDDTLDEQEEPLSPMSVSQIENAFNDFETASPHGSPKKQSSLNRFIAPRSPGSPGGGGGGYGASRNSLSAGGAALVDSQSSLPYTLGGLSTMLSPTGGIPGRMPSITEVKSMEQIELNRLIFDQSDPDQLNQQNTDLEISAMSKQTTDFDMIPIEAVNSNNSTTRSMQLPHHQPVDTNQYKSDEFDQEQLRIMNRSDTDDLSPDDSTSPLHIDSHPVHDTELALCISPPPEEHGQTSVVALSTTERSRKLQNLSNIGIPKPSTMQETVSQEHFEQIQNQVYLLAKGQAEMQSMMHQQLMAAVNGGKVTPSANNSMGNSSLSMPQPFPAHWAAHSLMTQSGDGTVSLGIEGAAPRMSSISSQSRSRTGHARCKYDVAFLVAQPLLHLTGTEWRPVETLDADQEEKAMYVMSMYIARGVVRHILALSET